MFRKGTLYGKGIIWGWSCRSSGTTCISYSETHWKGDSMVKRGCLQGHSFWLHCFQDLDKFEACLLSQRGESTKRRVSSRNGGNKHVGAKLLNIYKRQKTFMGCFCLLRPGLLGGGGLVSAWSLQSRPDLQSRRFMLPDNGSAMLNIQLMCVLGSLFGDLVSFSLPSWVEALLRYLWKGSIEVGRDPAEFSAISLLM